MTLKHRAVQPRQSSRYTAMSKMRTCHGPRVIRSMSLQKHMCVCVCLCTVSGTAVKGYSKQEAGENRLQNRPESARGKKEK